MTDQPDPINDPTTADRLIEVVDLLRQLVTATDSGTAAVAAETVAREKAMAEERRHNRVALAALGIAFSVALLVGGFAGYDRFTRNEVTCGEKLERADIADQRALIVARSSADFARLSDASKTAYLAQVTKDLAKLPPPC